MVWGRVWGMETVEARLSSKASSSSMNRILVVCGKSCFEGLGFKVWGVGGELRFGFRIKVHRGISLIRNCAPPQVRHRALGIVLL